MSNEEAPDAGRGTIYKWMAGVAVPIAVAAIAANAFGVSPFVPEPKVTTTPTPYPVPYPSPSPVPEPTGPPAKIFTIKSLLSGKCLEISGDFSRLTIVQKTCAPTLTRQQWSLVAGGPDQWKFNSPYIPASCLTHLNGAIGSATRGVSGDITFEGCRSGNEQQWTIEELAGHRWRIARYGDNLCIAIPMGSQEEGKKMVDWTCNVGPSAANAVWVFEPVKA